jgi:hypothetical protein
MLLVHGEMDERPFQKKGTFRQRHTAMWNLWQKNTVK